MFSGYNAGLQPVIYMCTISQAESPEEDIPAVSVPDQALPFGRNLVCVVMDNFGNHVIWYIAFSLPFILRSKVAFVILVKEI